MTRNRQEGGFTLIEVLLTITLLTLLMGALSGVIIVSLRAVGGSSTRLSTSHDRQLVAVYLPRDLSSASGALSGVNVTSGSWNCPGVTAPPVLVLNWLGMPISTTTTNPAPLGSLALTAHFEADYVVVAQSAVVGVLPNNPSSYRLKRVYCYQPSGSATWASLSQTTIVYGLQSATAASASCATSTAGPFNPCNDPQPPPITGPPSPWVTLQVTDVTGASYSTTGQMRTNSRS